MKIRFAFATVLFFFFLCVSSFAQTERSTYLVLDQLTGQPIPFVHIKVREKMGSETTTDVRGSFSVASFIAIGLMLCPILPIT